MRGIAQAGWLRGAAAGAVAATLALGLAPARAQAPGPGADSGGDPAPLLLHILDYVAVDYPGAVAGGKIIDEGEYTEQVEFVAKAHLLLARLPARAERAELEAQAERLIGLVRDKRPAPEVAAAASGLRWAVIRLYRVEVAPTRAPDLARGAALYATHCALCHGPAGRGDGSAGVSLDPRPSDFHDAERMAQRSLYGLYSTITLGVDGTGMASFRALGEDERWALAFHVAGLGASEAERRRGEALWRAGKGRAAFIDLGSIATRSPRELTERHGPDAPALLAYLRTQPDALAGGGSAALATTRRLLRESLDAYRAGRAREAHDLAVSAYLDGFELVEPSLDAVDRALRVTAEAEMLRYRTLVRDGAPLDAVAAQAARVEEILARAGEALARDGLPPAAAFVSAFVILLREGLEALLVIVAMAAVLVKAGRRDALRWLYVGGGAALALGGLTWVLAAYVIEVSGAARETSEGIIALLAAGVLLSVGFWMHRQSQADRWLDYLTARLSGALSARATGTLVGLSFLAVYREVFETVLFYQALAAQAGAAARLPVWGGLAAGAVALVVVGWGMVRGSLRLPLGPFFRWSALLLAALALMFAGKGIAALQEAGVIPIHGLAVPALPLLGLYASVEGLALQAALALAIVVAFVWMRRAHASP